MAPSSRARRLPSVRRPRRKLPPLPLPAIPITIDLVTLSKLSATFVDESIQPTVSTGIRGFERDHKRLVLQAAGEGQGVAGRESRQSGALKIQGQINPLTEDAFTNLKFLFQGLDLTAVSPYAGKYAGYPITKGKLSLDLKYQVSKKQLVGENKVLVDQFTFGEKTEALMQRDCRFAWRWRC